MKTKKQVEFLTFFEVYVFSQWNFSWSMGQFFGSAVTNILQKIRGVAPGLFIFEVFTGLWLSTPTFCIKGYDYVKRFVRVLGLLLINTGCPKIAKKWGTLHDWFPVQTILTRHINVCTGGDLSFPFFSETPCMKVGFSVRISLVWWMRALSCRWEIPFSICLPRLYLYLRGTAAF